MPDSKLHAKPYLRCTAASAGWVQFRAILGLEIYICQQFFSKPLILMGKVKYGLILSNFLLQVAKFCHHFAEFGNGNTGKWQERSWHNMTYIVKSSQNDPDLQVPEGFSSLLLKISNFRIRYQYPWTFQVRSVSYTRCTLVLYFRSKFLLKLNCLSTYIHVANI